MHTWLAILLITSNQLAVGATQANRPTDASGWQSLARTELSAVHDAIRAAHPGVIDTQNPSFNRWVEDGYREALQSVPQAMDYESFISVVRIYTTGFRDGHLAYSDNIRSKEDTIVIDGWSVRFNDDKYTVSFVADDWPVTLPQPEWEWLGCDGESPRAIVQAHVAPFLNRQVGLADDEMRALSVWIRFLPGLELKRCTFRDQQDQTYELPVAYRGLKTDAFFSLAEKIHDVAHTNCSRHNTMIRIGQVLWVHAGNFNFQSQCNDAQELDSLLKTLPNEKAVRTIVFDVRGNGGGDSSIGDRIFDAATGGLDFDRSHLERLPRMYAQWRVSDVLLATAKRTHEREVSLYGADSAQAKDAQEFLESVQSAQAKGETWVEQPSGYRITEADVAARHGKLKHFAGTIAVVTDAGCASACLDFVDRVKQIPHSLQLGQTTSSDTVYIDIGSVPLPSGNHMILPLKVWRNRLRSNDEAYIPDIPLRANLRDDDAVQSAVLAALAIPKGQ